MSEIVNIIVVDGEEKSLNPEEYSEIIQDRVMIETIGYKRKFETENRRMD